MWKVVCEVLELSFVVGEISSLVLEDNGCKNADLDGVFGRLDAVFVRGNKDSEEGADELGNRLLFLTVIYETRNRAEMHSLH